MNRLLAFLFPSIPRRLRALAASLVEDDPADTPIPLVPADPDWQPIYAHDELWSEVTADAAAEEYERAGLHDGDVFAAYMTYLLRLKCERGAES